MKPKRKRIVNWDAPGLSQSDFDECEEMQAHWAQQPRPQSQDESHAKHLIWLEQQLLKTPSLDGWNRLNELLMDAIRDQRVQSSAGALEFANDCQQLAQHAALSIVLNGEPLDAIGVFKVLMADLAADQLSDNTGRFKGGATMKQIKEAHIAHLTKPVIDLLKNPKTSDWKDSQIAKWLMTTPNTFHVFMHRGKRRELKEKAMTNHVKEIRAAYKASI